ncbi:hypothetical protein [Kineosporia sp. A_224]|uniref:hypothetical protein n=1 Tax=Kineosporia sp. A_224 TaxID=1962180 RepID=UPI00117A1EB1|nr:hypothetical protein [Kineosporia sp. A_224]
MSIGQHPLKVVVLAGTVREIGCRQPDLTTQRIGREQVVEAGVTDPGSRLRPPLDHDPILLHTQACVEQAFESNAASPAHQERTAR